MTAQHTLSDLAQTVRLIVRPGEARKRYDKRSEWEKGANDYRLTLVYQGRRYSFDYWQGAAARTQPEVAEVLETVLAAEVEEGQTFREWCREFGYSDDSVKALRIFRACKRQTAALRRLFGDDFETFASAERN
jgi:hypothetical protein